MGLWSSIKRAVKRVAKAVANVVHEAVTRVLGIPDFLLTYLGILPTKRLRLKILILRNAAGEVIAPEKVAAAAARAKQVLRDNARVEIIASGGSLIETVEETAPASALKPHCDLSGFGDELGEAGEFYDMLTHKYHPEGTFPSTLLRTPITCFIVENIRGKNGCSLGPLTNYITLDVDGVGFQQSGGDDVSPFVARNTMAHEIGHSCFLLHRDDPDNLMFAGNERGDHLTQWQLMVIRSSRRVSWF